MFLWKKKRERKKKGVFFVFGFIELVTYHFFMRYFGKMETGKESEREGERTRERWWWWRRRWSRERRRSRESCFLVLFPHVFSFLFQISKLKNSFFSSFFFLVLGCVIT